MSWSACPPLRTGRLSALSSSSSASNGSFNDAASSRAGWAFHARSWAAPHGSGSRTLRSHVRARRCQPSAAARRRSSSASRRSARRWRRTSANASGQAPHAAASGTSRYVLLSMCISTRRRARMVADPATTRGGGAPRACRNFSAKVAPSSRVSRYGAARRRPPGAGVLCRPSGKHGAAQQTLVVAFPPRPRQHQAGPAVPGVHHVHAQQGQARGGGCAGLRLKIIRSDTMYGRACAVARPDHAGTGCGHAIRRSSAGCRRRRRRALRAAQLQRLGRVQVPNGRAHSLGLDYTGEAPRRLLFSLVLWVDHTTRAPGFAPCH